MKLSFIKRYIVLIGILWSLACAAALTSHLHDDYQQTLELVQTRAETILEREFLYLQWVASHGGVYVAVDESLTDDDQEGILRERDIKTDGGLHLTLVDPTNMSRLVFEMNDQPVAISSKITSLSFQHSDSAPDQWERDALRRLEQGSDMVSDVVETSGQSFLKVMRPFPLQAALPGADENQGSKPGDIAGGLYVSVPFEPFLSGYWYHNLESIGLFALLWLVGLACTALLGRKLYAQTDKALESERQRDHAEMSLNFLSNYDHRTNLPNRFKFEEHLADLFREVDSCDGRVAVTALEVRNYKQIIDNFDHPVGDSLFRLLAERISLLLPEVDSVARFGEDRLLFSYTCQGQQLFSEGMTRQILAAASKPLVLEKHEFYPVICMGAALFPDDAMDAKNLLQKVVSALTFCQEKKASGIMLYSQSLQAESKTRLEIESGLRKTLAENNFELFLQPQFDAVNCRLIGAEALLRWQMEGRGYVSPNEFIPAAEKNDLILPIGEWVLQTACIQALKLKQRFGHVIPIGVNVSAKQFQDPEFIDIVDEVLAIEGVSPEMLEIEITEGTFIKDIDRTIELLTDLKVRGLQIAIDDFGTGYSSLSYLNRFPVDRLKIDRSFVADIADNEEDRILVSLIVEMGRKLGLSVVAEGVENDMQRHLLIGMGCRDMQGFLFSRPVSFDDFCALAEEFQEP